MNVDLTKCSTAAETAGKKTCSGTVGKTVMNNLTTGTTGYSSQVQLNADHIYKVTELVAPGKKPTLPTARTRKPSHCMWSSPATMRRSPDSKTYNGKYDNLVISDNKSDSGSLTVGRGQQRHVGQLPVVCQQQPQRRQDQHRQTGCCRRQRSSGWRLVEAIQMGVIPKRRKPGRIGLHQCRVSAKIPLVPH